MKIAFHTLGCKVNQYETEAMAARFKERGHVIVGEDEFADVYVVNTCTVTAMADRKSRQFIRRMKKKNPDSIIAVTGCYVQIDPDSVASIEGVDIITGINEKSSLPDYVEEYAKATNGCEHDHVWKHIRSYDDLGVYEDMGTVTSAENRTRAYIKVQDGCNRFCSYCVIPYARGAVRSRPLEQIVEEAVSLIEAGYKEIVLTGINTALYGEMEAEGSGEEICGIETVIAALDKLEGDFRIRLSSLEPTVVDAEYVKKLLKYDKLCHHLHLSAQSGSDRVLKEMNRSYTVEEYEDIVRILRDFDPLYGVSADIIAGFPGETDEDVEKSAGLIKRCGFCRTHIFRYSNRPGTTASQRKSRAFVIVLLGGLFCLMIVLMSATAANLRRLNNDLEAENAYLQAEIDSLETKIGTATNINRIEDIAVNELGMVHPSTENCISMTDDKIENTNLAVTIKREAYD